MDEEKNTAAVNDTEQDANLRTIVVTSGKGADLQVAGLGLFERWEKVSHKFSANVVRTESSALIEELKSTAGPVVIAEETSVVDEVALESYFQKQHGNGEVVVLEKDELGPVPALFLGAEAAHDIAEAAAGEQTLSVSSCLKIAAGIDSMEINRIVPDRAYWSTVNYKKDADAATWGLLSMLQHRPGGLVAKYINRPVSLRISRHLLDTPISPNMVTIIDFIIGAVGIYFIFRGGWLNAVIGTGLMQINSIIDGIDGELARMRLQTSEFGAYLDSVCDEILNAALMMAVGHYLATSRQWEPYLYIGIFTGIMAFAYALVHWHCKWKHGLGFYWWFEAYKPRVEVQRSTSVFTYFKKLFWKESYLFIFFVLAIFDVMHWMLFVGAAGAAAVFLLFIIHIPVKKARW